MLAAKFLEDIDQRFGLCFDSTTLNPARTEPPRCEGMTIGDPVDLFPRTVPGSLSS